MSTKSTAKTNLSYFGISRRWCFAFHSTKYVKLRFLFKNRILWVENIAFSSFYLDKIKFVREESLSNIAAVEMIDLPLSDAEGGIENEFNSKPGK